MPIQNTSGVALVPQPTRLASDGGPGAAAVATPSNVAAQPSVSLELPKVAAKQVAEQQLSPEQLKNAMENANKAMKQANTNLEFSVDTKSNRAIVKVVDTETGSVVRQFPSEEALAISRSIDRIQQGLLLNQKA